MVPIQSPTAHRRDRPHRARVTQSTAGIIERNLAGVRATIAKACDRAGRNSDDVTLIAVTKSVGPEEVQILYDLGLRHFGESRLHEAETKINLLGNDVVWHMVGHVQRRKVGAVVEQFDRIDSVDRIELAQAIERKAGEAQKVIPVLAEVNVSGEANKDGFSLEEAAEAAAALNEMEHIDIQGLMTMAPRVDDPESVRVHFARLRQLGGDLGLSELSMGMSEDYAVAIEEGATQVRIGRALFRA